MLRAEDKAKADALFKSLTYDQFKQKLIEAGMPIGRKELVCDDIVIKTKYRAHANSYAASNEQYYFECESGFAA